MRITKLPIPLLLAAAALTSVVYIYVHLTAPPMPIHTDPNFTQPLISGVTYLWRGAAFRYIFSADSQISVAYGTPYHLVYLFGPLYNISLAGGKIHVLYGAKIRPLFVIKHDLVSEDGNLNFPGTCLVYNLKDITPQNSTTGNLTLYLPVVFDLNDVLTKDEYSAITNFVDCTTRYRVIQIQVNSTHIIFQTAYPDSGSWGWRLLLKLQPPVSGKTISVTNQPITGSYTVGSATFAIMALPYLHFAITPQDTTTLTIYVS